MTARRWMAPILCAALAMAAACGDDEDDNGGGGGGGGAADGGLPSADGGVPAGQFTITISDFAFNPSNLTVPPGATVTVVNLDPTPHSVTSQSAPEQFTPGSVAGVSFDTGPFTGTASFTIPPNAPDGTVVPYYCTVDLQAMANDGQITISRAAGGGADAGGAGADAGGGETGGGGGTGADAGSGTPPPTTPPAPGPTY